MKPLSYLLTIQHDADTDEAYIELPPDLLQRLGWQDGTTLEWLDNKNGTFTLREYNDQCS